MTGVPDRLAVADVMVAALAREIVDGDVVGVGLGTPLALAAALLARATHAPGSHVVAGGTFDAAADLPDYLAGSARLRGRVAGYLSHFDSMDMAERQAMTLQFLRPAQVDGGGNLNTSRIGASVRFPGGLATADVPSLLPRVVAYLPDHRLRNLPERVAFVTGAGAGRPDPVYPSRGVTALVTDLAVIALGPGGAVLASVHPWATVDEVVERTGFTLAVGGTVPVTPPPAAAAAEALRRIDPRSQRMAEIKGVREPVAGGA